MTTDMLESATFVSLPRDKEEDAPESPYPFIRVRLLASLSIKLLCSVNCNTGSALIQHTVHCTQHKTLVVS